MAITHCDCGGMLHGDVLANDKEPAHGRLDMPQKV